MNCPICGTPLGNDEQSCRNCGVRRSEMGINYNSPSQNMMYSTNNSGCGINNFGNLNAAAPKIRRTIKTVHIVTSVIMILVTVGCFLYRNVYLTRSVTEDLGDFTVTFPNVMKENKSSPFLNLEADKCAVYSNQKLAFAYAKFDISDYELTESELAELEEQYISDMDAACENGLENYRKKDIIKNTLRFYFTENNENYFSVMRGDTNNDAMYLFVAYCLEKDENNYTVKMRSMLDSIKFK